MLAVSFAIIYACAKASLAKKEKYPKVDCDDFTKDYGSRLDIWENDAVVEHKVNHRAEELAQETHYSGAMQCFCQYQKDNGAAND